MSLHYRPFTLARAGELAALGHIARGQRSGISPVFQVPPRPWDFDNATYLKSTTDHLTPLPAKLADCWAGSRAYIDTALLDDESPVGGVHPLEYIVRECRGHGLDLVPVVSPTSSPVAVAAARASHRMNGLGAAIRLPQADWTTINGAALQGVVSQLAVAPSDVDLLLDFEDAHGAVVEVALISELTALRSAFAFRSVSVGGDCFPVVTGVPRGVTEYPRDDWATFANTVGRLVAAGHPVPDFFDHLILRTDSIDLGVDPRFMNISAALRYTVADRWLLAKGELFKGSGGSGKGGSALVDPLKDLRAHPDFATPVRSQADDWIDDVVSGSASPGNPTKWREWGTVRHVEVTVEQLANLP